MKVILLTDQIIQSEKAFIIGGWIRSLISTLQQSSIIELAVIGLTEGESCVEKEHNTTFYKVKKRSYSTPFERIYRRWKCTIQDDSILKQYLAFIEDYNPDIVQIFGVESFLCNLIPHIKSKVVVHLQGLLNPYLNAFFPPGISKNLYNFCSFKLANFVRGFGPIHDYRTFRKMAKRELTYFRHIRFVMGRTYWDKAIASTLGENMQYFHSEESLRSDFYTDLHWSIKRREEVKFISVLSPSTYKGFDVILKTAYLLKSKNIRFRWNVCGTSETNSVVKTMEKILKKKYMQNNVSFLGRKTSEELIPVLLDSDIFIHPSYIENSPNSICEAQMLGMPVIATYTGGTPSLIENEKTGILFPTNDIYLLSDIIMSLLSNPQKMQELGRNARIVAWERHDRNNILKNIESIYAEITEM